MSKIEKSIQAQINEWFHGDRNYKTGLSLLKESGFNQRGLLKTFEKGESKDNKLHLVYQLFKISDHTDPKICNEKKVEKDKTKNKVAATFLPPANVIPSKPPVADTTNAIDDNELSFTAGSDKAILLAQITEKQKSHYNKRAQAHKEMSELGDINDADTVSKRVEFLNVIAKHTEIVDYLHNVKKQWKETGVIPDEEVLTFEPEQDQESEPDGDKNVVVDEIPAVDLHNELAKVRSRLSKYSKKMKDLSGKKLKAMQEKQAKDEALKVELTTKLNAVRNK